MTVLVSPPKTGSLLRLENALVENLCGAARWELEELREALSGGVPFTKDRKRQRFYEVEVGSRWYYIHVLKGTGKILLLASAPLRSRLGCGISVC